MVRQNATTTEATIYHRKFRTDDGDRHEVGADLGMGYEFACDHDADPVDVFPDAYDYAGDVTVDVPDDEDTEEAAAYAYDLWDNDGIGHDPRETRSMAVGDIIVADGDAWFVDRIGFVSIDLPGVGDDEDDDTASPDDYYGMTYDPTPTDAEIAEAFGVDDVDDITDEMLADVDTDVPDALGEVVDLSGYKTASGAAKAAAKKIRAIAEEFGHDPSLEVTCRRVEDTDGSTAYWRVSYPGGDYDWAVRMTGGDAVYGAEPLLTGFYGGDAWQVECGNGTTLDFYPR